MPLIVTASLALEDEEDIVKSGAFLPKPEGWTTSGDCKYRWGYNKPWSWDDVRIPFHTPEGRSRPPYAYLHEDAQRLAGYDIPEFLFGDLGQLDESPAWQSIWLIVHNKFYELKSEVVNPYGYEDPYGKQYYLTLK